MFYIEYLLEKPGIGKIKAQGTVPLQDGTKIDWYLWDGARPKIHSYAAMKGYIACLYKDELYDVTNHHSTYRSFGVSEGIVRENLWLVIRPVVDPDGKRGVYPRTDPKSPCLCKAGRWLAAHSRLVIGPAEFADNMPDDLVEAVALRV